MTYNLITLFDLLIILACVGGGLFYGRGPNAYGGPAGGIVGGVVLALVLILIVHIVLGGHPA